MNGKDKCRILKQIRAEIARKNDIAFVVQECTHQGACRGTCPRCESEVRYLEEQLEKRRSLKKRVALAGVSAGVMLSLSGCSAIDAITDALDVGPAPGVMPVPTEEITLEGEVAAPTQEPPILLGEVEMHTSDPDVLTGMVAPEVD